MWQRFKHLRAQALGRLRRDDVAAGGAAGAAGDGRRAEQAENSSDDAGTHHASVSNEPAAIVAGMTSTPSAQVDTETVADLNSPARELFDAVELARDAALTEADERGYTPADVVGAHVESFADGSDAVTHRFDASVPGYRGWRWEVTVAAAGSDFPVTVSEVLLRPGPDALVAKEWVPWDQRIRPGDLGIGDLFPTDPDDPRLVPGYVESDDPAVEDVAMELGLGRERVLSREGRLDAAERWRSGEFGPRSDMARSVRQPCGTCGFYQPVAGSLRAAFGVCCNEFAPADGHVVNVEYGCGAHSQIRVSTSPSVPVAELVYDDSLLDFA